MIKPVMNSGYAWMLSVVIPLLIITFAVYIGSPMRDGYGYISINGGLIIVLGFIAGIAVVIWVWTFHKVE